MTARPHQNQVGTVLAIPIVEDYARSEQIFKALASERRLQILNYLTSRTSSVGEIAEALDMPNSTTAMHINVLEKAGLVQTELTPANRGLQKVCFRVYDQMVFQLPRSDQSTQNTIDIAMPIGAYVDCNVHPTCGLAGEIGIIGELDDVSSFYEPDRVHAQLIWFKHGYVEYRFPNRLPPNAILDGLQISLELCSEAPLHDENWPSDITMWINGVEIGTWTSPADFGGQRGSLTPDWWEEWSTQYGLLKIWKVTDHGAYVDGFKVSETSLSALNIGGRFITVLRIGVKEDAANLGGINIFGKKFGNYPQDFLMRLTYAKTQKK